MGGKIRKNERVSKNDPILREILQKEMGKLRADGLQLVEKHMFGGIAYLLEGKMLCGIVEDKLMLRVPKESTQEALARPHTMPMDFTGKPMRGFLYLREEGWSHTATLRRWISESLHYVQALPPPKKRKGKATIPKARRI